VDLHEALPSWPSCLLAFLKLSVAHYDDAGPLAVVFWDRVFRAPVASDAMTSYDLVAAGETMAALVGDPPGQLGAGGRLLLDAGGAESNVAICLARAGHRVAWLSRLGADSLGRMVARRVAEAGVDISLTQTDPDAPTGLYLREPGQVWYYRAGSAASRMTPSIWADTALRGAGVVYLTGITPALSPSCHDLVTRALRSRPVAGACYAFDVNHRPSLWPPKAAAGVLAGLARRADLVFVGRDEAHALWGTASAGDVRDLLPEPSVLVVKDAEVGATSYGPHGRVHIPAPPVQVVDPVGAGDAFAAGYLHGLLRGEGEAQRLAIGHRFAAAVLCVAGDIADAGVADAAPGTIKQKGSRHADL
jgi:2-dehydro-3-deoxygluconokinase